MEVLVEARHIAARAHKLLMGFWEESGWKGRFTVSSEMGIPGGLQGLEAVKHLHWDAQS